MFEFYLLRCLRFFVCFVGIFCAYSHGSGSYAQDSLSSEDTLIDSVVEEVSQDTGGDSKDDKSHKDEPLKTDVESKKSGDNGDDLTSISAPTASEPTAQDFFDAENLVPKGEMSKNVPVKVNPSLQPASKLISVKKDYEVDSRTAQIVSAERAMSLGRYDSALQMFESLTTENSRDSRVLMGRAVSLQKLGRFDEAMQAYERLSEIEPHNIGVKVNMLGLLSTRYPSVALRRLLDLHKDHSNHVGLTSQIAVAYAQTGDIESAMRYFGMAVSMEPNNANHLFNMAVMLDRADQPKKAIEYYEQALEVDSIHGGGRSIPRDSVYERLAQIR